MSRAVVTWLRSGRPEALRKVVRFIPSARARVVIFSANRPSLPPRRSATTVAASLADLVISARIAWRTVIVSPGFSPSRDGGREAATAETFIGVFSRSALPSSASNSRYSVIILVSEAG